MTSPISLSTRRSSPRLIARKNARRADAVALELKALGKLPRHRTTDFSVATVTVVRSGTITVRGVLYSVPSRLVGARLKVHIYDSRIVCYLGTTPVLELDARLEASPRQGERAVSTTAI